MNKQCRNCTKPTLDENLKTIGVSVFCPVCFNTVSRENIVYGMLTSSYSDETAREVTAIVREMELEGVQLKCLAIAMNAYPDSDLVELAKTLMIYSRTNDSLHDRIDGLELEKRDLINKIATLT